jgi:uncharacterized membrane protein YeaQ/YmgE (transglycosylase-associated protein family)
MLARLIITAITYLVAGLIPPLVAHYLIRVRFIGGIWAAMLVGVIGAFAGGLLDVFVLGMLPDIIPIGRMVDGGPPLVLAILFVLLFALVSRSNE